MNCDKTRELLSLYIDNMLDESQAGEVEEHLSACDDCREEYQQLKEMLDLLGQVGMVPIPDAFQLRLKKALTEEKRNIAEAGINDNTAKRKNRWRLITSIAAVFIVGVLSFGLYQDIQGNLPEKMKIGEQSDAAIPQENAATESGASEKAADMAEASDDGTSSDGSVVMKEQAANLQEPQMMTREADPYDDAADKNKTFDASGGAAMDTYSFAADSEPYAGEGAAAGVSPPEPTDGSMNDSLDFAMKSRIATAQDECNRSLAVSGVERNTAAVQYYNSLIEEKLAGFDYQVLGSYYAQIGEWQFRIFIFRGKEGNTYNEEIMIIGKDGEIEIICSDGFPGL